MQGSAVQFSGAVGRAVRCRVGQGPAARRGKGSAAQAHASTVRSGRAIALFLLFLALQTACPHLRWVRATSGPALTSQILNQAAHATPQKGTAPTDAPNPIYLESYHEYRTTEPASTYQFCSRFTSLLY